jgi:hypothetical protein
VAVRRHVAQPAHGGAVMPQCRHNRLLPLTAIKSPHMLLCRAMLWSVLVLQIWDQLVGPCLPIGNVVGDRVRGGSGLPVAAVMLVTAGSAVAAT